MAGKRIVAVSPLAHRALNAAQGALKTDSVHPVVQQRNNPTQAVFGADVAVHDTGPAAQHDQRHGVKIEARFHDCGEQPLGIQPALFVHDAAHLIRQAAGLPRQHLLDLRVGERKTGFLADPLADLVDAADHPQLQTVCRFRYRQGVVDPHQIHRPAADVHEQQRRFVGQQVRLGHQGGKALGKQLHIRDGDAVFHTLVAELDRLGRTKQIATELRLVPAIAGQRQARCDPDCTLRGGAPAADFLRQCSQRQQVVVVIDGFVTLDRLPSGAANKKTPAGLKESLAGVRFVVAVSCKTGWERTMPSLDGVIAVIDANVHSFDERTFVKGFLLILWGFFLKLCIADKASVIVNTVFDQFPTYQGTYVLIAGILYSFQLYADFLACTSFAQGFAELVGIELVNNFQRPYFSKSIKEFWRRWHISLSSWLKDYVYIPLGGNRKGIILPNIRYHSRWTSLGEEDFTEASMVAHGGIKGFTVMSGNDPNLEYTPFHDGEAENVDPDIMMEPSRTYLAKTIELCQEKGIQVILINIPCAESIGRYRSTKTFAEEYGVPYYDFNEATLYNEIGYDASENLLSHPNYLGAEKISLYIGKMLAEQYGIAPREDSSYNASRQLYEHNLQNIRLQDTTDIYEYLPLLNQERYSIFVFAPTSFSACIDEDLMNMLFAMGFATELREVRDGTHYCALKDASGFVEQLTEEDLQFSGAIRNGLTTYSFQVDTTNMVHKTYKMMVDGTDCSGLTTGLNFVVYDNEQKQVIDRVNFNTTTEELTATRY